MIKKFVYRILRYTALFAGLIVIYISFLMAGELIPRRLMTENAMRSYYQLQELGLYFEGVAGAEWDNWTDAYFINSAVTEYDGNILQKAAANAYTTYDTTDTDIATNTIKDIKKAVEGGGVIELYSRYWVGMLTIYRILLIFMPVNSIRALIFGIAVMLFALSAICVYRTLGFKGLVPYLISVVTAQYIPQAMCLVFNTDISIMFFMMIICSIMLHKKASAESYYLLFFLAGSILAYLNYWAFPLITLGFPLIYVITTKLILKTNSTQELVKETGWMSISWGAGLAATVLAKQILCKAVLGNQSGTSQLLTRMGAEFTMSERLVSVVNGVVRRLESAPVLIITIVVALWVTAVIITGRLKRKYSCFLLVLIAFYPLIWWFALPNHCMHGFVKHMYGVSYYALLSAALINCQRGMFRGYDGKSGKKGMVINTAVFAIWICMFSVMLRADVHYGAKEAEPWSLEASGMVNLGGERNGSTAVQDIHFENFTMSTAYLKSISTILVNLPDDKKDGILHVELLENGSVAGMADILIADVAAGEWFEIPIKCAVKLGQEYQVTYTVRDNILSQPYLLMQDKTQAAKENDTLYIDGAPAEGMIANKYAFDEFILSAAAKICILFMVLAFMEYGIFWFEEEKMKKKMKMELKKEDE